MPHYPRPWERTSNGKSRGWYVTLDREQIPLGPDCDAAFVKYHDLMAERGKEPKARQKPVEPAAQLVVLVLDRFLGFCKLHRKETTYKIYKSRLESFAKWLKAQKLADTLTVAELKPYHLTDWSDSHPTWNRGMKHDCIGAVQTALNRGTKQGWIQFSPVAKVDKPAAGRRDIVVSEAEYAKILTLIPNQRFKELLILAWETGARPQELVRVEARHYDDGVWLFPDSEGKGDRHRRIFLNDTARAIAERVNKEWPEGPVLRNTKGKPWRPWAVNCGFERLKPKIGRKLFLGAFRHTFCTTALKNGVDPITVAVMLGHKDPSMVARTYSHLNQDVEYVRKKVLEVRK